MFKKLAILLLSFALLGGSLLRAQNAEARDLGPIIVSVKAPLGTSLLHDTQYEWAFFTALSNSLERSRHKASIDTGDTSQHVAGERLLEIQIIRWNFDRLGNAQCGFTAEITSEAGKKNLGLFSGIGLGITAGRGRFEAGRLLERAAEAAANDLWNKLAQLSE